METIRSIHGRKKITREHDGTEAHSEAARTNKPFSANGKIENRLGSKTCASPSPSSFVDFSFRPFVRVLALLPLALVTRREKVVLLPRLFRPCSLEGCEGATAPFAVALRGALVTGVATSSPGLLRKEYTARTPLPPHGRGSCRLQVQAQVPGGRFLLFRSGCCEPHQQRASRCPFPAQKPPHSRANTFASGRALQTLAHVATVNLRNILRGLRCSLNCSSLSQRTSKQPSKLAAGPCVVTLIVASRVFLLISNT